MEEVSELTGADGQPMSFQPRMALYRCGKSANKPFCDGAHAAEGFAGQPAEKVGTSKTRLYRGQEITVGYNITICAHAAACVTGLPAVFDMNARPWIQPDNAAADGCHRRRPGLPFRRVELLDRRGDPDRSTDPNLDHRTAPGTIGGGRPGRTHWRRHSAGRWRLGHQVHPVSVRGLSVDSILRRQPRNLWVPRSGLVTGRQETGSPWANEGPGF